MIVKLTKRAVDALTPSDRPILAYDTDLKGFGVRVARSGSLSWFIEYRPGAGGRRVAKRRMYFGGREFTPEQARQAVRKCSHPSPWERTRLRPAEKSGSRRRFGDSLNGTFRGKPNPNSQLGRVQTTQFTSAK